MTACAIDAHAAGGVSGSLRGAHVLVRSPNGSDSARPASIGSSSDGRESPKVVLSRNAAGVARYDIGDRLRWRANNFIR